jgi:putative ABC transport system permease protein
VDGFRFPVDHQFWIPLRANPLQYERLHGPSIYMFGRLAPGVMWDGAQAELTTIGQRAAAAYPQTHERLRPVILPYTREHLDLTDPDLVWLLRIAQILIGALSFVVAVNLAILVYARTVTRLGEIAVRTALGASRRRILAQLFIEALAWARRLGWCWRISHFGESGRSLPRMAACCSGSISNCPSERRFMPSDWRCLRP